LPQIANAFGARSVSEIDPGVTTPA
jgi:hypothetical protein